MAQTSKSQRKPMHHIGKTIVRKGEDISFDYKNVELLSRFLSERGSILSRERTGLSSKKQRELSAAIKQARHVALLPFVTTL